MTDLFANSFKYIYRLYLSVAGEAGCEFLQMYLYFGGKEIGYKSLQTYPYFGGEETAYESLQMYLQVGGK